MENGARRKMRMSRRKRRRGRGMERKRKRRGGRRAEGLTLKKNVGVIQNSLCAEIIKISLSDFES